MKRFAIDGVEYACPFWDAVRPHTPAELAALTEGILRKRKILYPVINYISPRWGRAIVDGMTRITIALAYDIEIPLEEGFVELTDAEAFNQAVSLNLARRHLTPEEQQRLREERVPRVAQRRAAGEPLRRIALNEDISPTQVLRDLDAAAAIGLLEKPADAPKKKPTPASGYAAKLMSSVRLLMGNREKRERLRAIAAGYHVPLGDDGRSWPALEAVAAAIRDLTPGKAA